LRPSDRQAKAGKRELTRFLYGAIIQPRLVNNKDMFFKKKNQGNSVALCSICYHGLKQEDGFFCALKNNIVSIVPEYCDVFCHFAQAPIKKPRAIPLCEICIYSEKDESDKPNYCLKKKEPIIKMPITFCEVGWDSIYDKPLTTTSQISCPVCKIRKMRYTTGSRFVCENGHIFS
jgi:hypothetical protein